MYDQLVRDVEMGPLVICTFEEWSGSRLAPNMPA